MGGWDDGGMGGWEDGGDGTMAGVHKNVNCLRDFFSSDKLSKKVRDIKF